MIGKIIICLLVVNSLWVTNIDTNTEVFPVIDEPREVKMIEPEWCVYEATAYTASDDECGKSDGITASGKMVDVGQVAMSTSIPFGTKIYIDGLGEFEVTDRGGAIHGNRIDIYMPTKQQAFEFGCKQVKVYFL